MVCSWAETINIRNGCVVQDGLLHTYIYWSGHNGNLSPKEHLKSLQHTVLITSNKSTELQCVPKSLKITAFDLDTQPRPLGWNVNKDEELLNCSCTLQHRICTPVVRPSCPISPRIPCFFTCLCGKRLRGLHRWFCATAGTAFSLPNQ
jgi:hypothetical protein